MLRIKHNMVSNITIIFQRKINTIGAQRGNGAGKGSVDTLDRI